MGLRPFHQVAACLFAAVVLQAPSVRAQAAELDSVYSALQALAPLPDQVADVQNLVLHRDVGEFTLEAGQLALLSPVGGRTVALAFHGQGTFRFTPPTRIERERLRHFRKSTTLAQPFTDLVILFSDSTLDELRHTLTFKAGPPPDHAADRAKDLLDLMGDVGDRILDPDVLRPLLNGESSALFVARVSGRGDPLIFMIDPDETEAVRLLMPARHATPVVRTEVMTQFRPGADSVIRPLTQERVPQVRIARYDIETWLTQTSTGDVGFAAAAGLDIVADVPAGPWLPFVLFPKLQVDSARWSDGSTATVVKARDDVTAWVRLPSALAPAAHASLRLYYHGDLIDRYGDWFFLKSSVAWYPQPPGWRDVADFGLTFHYPRSMTLASVGQRTSLATDDRTTTSTWTVPHPIRNASFNLGIFDTHAARESSGPAVTVLWSERGHRQLTRQLMQEGEVVQQRDMEKRVGEDVSGAMQFFGTEFGPPPVSQFYATEIPYLHGEAFPGLIHLSYVTFVTTGKEGDDEVFRSHEVAHQWWGIGVDYATYHDQWLSEGFSDFAGLWYMQTRRHDNDKYFAMLDRWRTDILARRGDSLPIWLGYRMDTRDPLDNNYSVIVYRKGAWVVNMLRVLLLDLRSMKEDRFTDVMQDFYRSYAGKRATTADFQHVIEKHVGQPMGWFFDQWVYDWNIPTYRVAWKAEPDGQGGFQVRLRVRQDNVPPTFLAYVPVTVQLKDGRAARLRVKVVGAQTETVLPVALDAEPQSLVFNDLAGVLAEVKTEGW
jgi:hypothetical protein